MPLAVFTCHVENNLVAVEIQEEKEEKKANPTSSRSRTQPFDHHTI
jgi:hypothetical protein